MNFENIVSWDKKIIGERIKSLRKEHSLNQIEFSTKIGITQSALSDIENGKSEPKVSTAVSISNEFKVTVDYLLKGNIQQF